MKLREWNARLHGLVVFRSLLDDPVVARLADLTDRMEAGAPGCGPVCDAVAQFEAALFEHTTNWGSYLSAAVLEAETVCVRQAAAGTLAPVLQTALDSELAFLQALCGLTLDELLARLTAVCGKCGLTLTKNQGIALLLLLAMSDRIGIVSSTPAPAATLIRNIAAAMGWERSFAHQISAEQRPMVALRPVDATPVLLLTSLPNYAPISGMHKLLLSRSSIGLTRNAAYDAGQWPILPLPALPFIPELPADDAAPISQAALTALLDATSVAKTSDEEITAVLSPIFAMVPPLSGAARAEMYRFIRVAAALMEGGLPVALDFAILLWVVPMVDRTSRNFADFKALLDEYPLSQAKL